MVRDIAVIVSNDSDLVFPIEHVKRHLGKIIGIINPHKRPSRELLALANFFKPIRPSPLAASQFPDRLVTHWAISTNHRLGKQGRFLQVVFSGVDPVRQRRLVKICCLTPIPPSVFFLLPSTSQVRLGYPDEQLLDAVILISSP